ncbi:MAG: phage head closure protein [Paracoccus sp. (in: a-proteobacteria)]|uniref:phage head closure protein n=1 Tax=Paracoccus sp. TaxID=267 RepID=UPI0026E03422|nr:phage head closure protein [Paracoccus sp. (in: a-proteobacteria)]MDO5621921.1 phage head closure protein [Paracoccus sp. (in: a-proteobacteria)]
MRAGDLTMRVVCQSKTRVTTPAGGWTEGWTDEFTVWANLRWLRGGEAVMQARQASRNPVIVTVRASRQARRISSTWRVVIGGKAFEVREDPRPTADRAYLEMLAEG